jgi:hypothetical protein
MTEEPVNPLIQGLQENSAPPPVEPTVSSQPVPTASPALTFMITGNADQADTALAAVSTAAAAVAPVAPVLAPSQTRHPWRATVRTAIAVTLGVASLLPEILGAAHVDNTVLGVQAIAVAAAVTRVIAVPGVNAFLTKLGVGAEPK